MVIAYGILLVLFWMQLIPHPANPGWFFIPSFLLDFLFLITVICLDLVATEKARNWTTIAWTLATANCTMITMGYFLQPGLLNPHHLNWQTGHLGIQGFETRNILVFIEYTNCFLLSASAFICSIAFRSFDTRALHRSLAANGLLLPIFAFCWFYPHYSYLESAWVITFSFANFRATRFFKTAESKLRAQEERIGQPVEWVFQ